MQEIIIRNFKKEDEPFVIDSWMKSFYNSSPFTTYLSRHEFQKRHAPLVLKLLDHSIIRLAVETESPDIILGYIVFNAPLNTVHYVYVKEAFRGFGICKRLIREAEYDFTDNPRVTHITERGKKLIEGLGYIYSPYFE